MPTIHVTIWDKDGKVVVDADEECRTATQDEIDQMVALIADGVPAHVAADFVLPD